MKRTPRSKILLSPIKIITIWPMERRRSGRIKLNVKAERISGDNKHGVFIENISATGIHMTTSSSKEHLNYIPGKDVDLQLSLTSGEIIHLRCKVRWSCVGAPPDALTDSIGLDIIDPPLQYIYFVKSLR
jgi:hypothetical protein